MAKFSITPYALLVLICNTLASNFPPRISVDSTIQQISEGAPIGKLLFTITAEDRNGGNVSILATGQTSELVNIDLTRNGHSATGNVTLKKKLDREKTSSHTMTFIATSSNKDAPSSSLTVTLFVTDVNDEKPQFSNQAYRVKIPENHNLTDINAGISATDPDNGAGGSVTYSIQPAGQASALYNDTFGIHEKSGKLFLKKTLDYERLTFYQYKIIAKDGGNPQQNSSADLLITVQDVQDTPPIFQGLPYMKDVKEDSLVDTSIFEVFALDGDTGIPNNISYSISGNCHSYIHINSSSGVISIKKTMDRDHGTIKDHRGVCSVNVTASENTSGSDDKLTKTTKPLIITVEDVNDNPPRFEKDTYYGSVKENMTDVSITVPGGINVSDIDQIGNNEIRLFVYKTGGNDTSFPGVEASPSTILSDGIFLLRLVNSFKFDYEKEENINLTIIAKDSRNDSLSGNCTLQVTINDTNDNDPVFTHINKTYHVPENSCFNKTVAEITATDADSGEYGEITYTLRGSESFQIDKESGRLYVSCNESCNNQCRTTDCDKSCLDREKKDVFYLTVEAKDGGGRRTPSSIVIYLDDTNDNKPIFRYTSYQIGLYENHKNFSDGKQEFRVEATDRDQLNNSVISYSIVKCLDNQNLWKHFVINGTNGIITINTTIDYEQLPTSSKGQVILTLMAQDHGTLKQSSTVNLTIDVKDENDNSPSFAEAYNNSVVENAKSGTFVLTVFATDADESKPNNRVAYFIEKGGSDQFTMDGTSGNISVQIGANLDRETTPTYNLTVIAIDKGDPQLTGSTSVIITLDDENDTPPFWDNLPKTISVLENTTVANVAQCLGKDLDIDAILNYSIVLKEAMDIQGSTVNMSFIKDSVFINDTSGIVSISKEGLDAEVAVKLTFEVTVNDTKTLKHKPNATSELIININDTNDNPPVFSQLNYTADVMENAPDGTYILALTATDADVTHRNRIIEYYIDNTTIPFSIDKTTGIVKKVGEIDREACDLWDIEVRATDSVHNATVTLHIAVLDFNDNTPYFLNSTYEFSENESTYNRTRIGALYAHDLDSGQNANITFSISGGNSQGHFQIDPYTGDLFINGLIDRENVSSYNLRVTIRDNPSNPAYRKSNTTKVTVHILDINDNMPLFVNDPKTTIYIKESTVNGTPVKTVHATDKDVGKNGDFSYQIGLAGNVTCGWFAINNNTGQIHIADSLKDQAGNYTLQVLAIDQGVPSLNSSVMLNIQIIDENLHTPHFTSLPPNNTVSIFECAKNYTKVFGIQAMDEDKAFVNSFLKYEFLYPNSSFGSHYKSFFINDASGDIYVVGKIDHETRPEYKIRVRCTDHGDPPLSVSSPELTIEVLDVNDNNPEFYQNITHTSVSENKTGTDVIQVTAHDRDSKAFIQYTITGGKYSDYFRINSFTGQIKTTKPLDREEVSVIKLMVQAKDVTKPQNISSQCPEVHHTIDVSNIGIEVVVAVKDVNDNPPNFTETHLSKGILRNTKFETVIQDLTKVVTDNDVLPENKIHRFFATSLSYTGTLKDEVQNKTIKTNCGKAFCVHPNGSVVTNFVISETMKGLARLQLVVNDSAGSSTASMKIYVISDSQIVAMHVIKKITQVDEIKFEVLKMYSDIIGYDCVYDEMETYKTVNDELDPLTTLLKFHVVDRKTDQILEAKDALKIFDSVSGGKGSTLAKIAKEYSIQSINLMQSGAADQSSQKIKETYILFAVIALLGLTLCIIIYFYIKSTKRYKTKLKAANVPTADRREKKKSIHLPGSNVYSSTKNPLMNKDEEVKRSMENLDKLDDVSLSGSENSLDPSDFEYAKRTMTYEEASEEKEVVMDMYVEDGMWSNSDVDPLSFALSQHEKQKNSTMNGNAHFTNGQINQSFDSLETTEV